MPCSSNQFKSPFNSKDFTTQHIFTVMVIVYIPKAKFSYSYSSLFAMKLIAFYRLHCFVILVFEFDNDEIIPKML